METLFEARIEQVRQLLPLWECEAILLTDMPNCRWVSGFTGSAASVLISADEAILATDSRYWEQAAEQAPDFDLFRHRRQPQDTFDLIHSVGVSQIGLEAQNVTLGQAAELQEIPGIVWKHLDRPLEPLRSIKTAAEVALIRAAAAITDTVMGLVPHQLQEGITEKQLAWLVEKEMRELGAESMAFPPIVAFGDHSARPHHAPADRPLQSGEIVLVDMGAKLDGYCSDLTRTFFYGEDDGRFATIYQAVLKGQTNALTHLAAGLSTKEAHLLAADSINADGYGDKFSHGLGHGIGLQIHEEPYLSATRPARRLEAGMVITVEPGIYLPGWGGVRLEDLAYLTDKGCDLLSHYPKQPLIAV